MNKSSNKSAFHFVYTLVIASLLIGFGCWFYQVGHSYPYYYSWDLDQITAIDSLLTQDGRLPVHVNHPGFGMYLMFKFTHGLAHALDWVSLKGIDDVAQALNPAAGIAELTIFLRNHSVVGALVLASALWLCLSVLFSPPYWLGALLLALFLGQDSLFYLNTHIRTELYGVMFCSIALACVAMALRSDQASRIRMGLIASGVFMGLSHQTKTQGFVLLMGFPFFFWLLRELVRKDESKLLPERDSNWLPGLAAVNLAVFAYYSIAAWVIGPPLGLKSFTEVYHYNITLVAVIGALAALLAVELRVLRLPRALNWVELGPIHLIWSGVLGSYLLHFLMYAKPQNSYKYLLYDFKMMFYRTGMQEGVLSPYTILMNYAPIFYRNPMPYVALVTAAAVLFWRSGFRIRLLVALSSYVVLFNAAFSARAVLRDIVWQEVPVTFLTAVFVLSLFTQLKHRAARMCCVALLGAALAAGLWRGNLMVREADATFNAYDWRIYFVTRPIYEGDHFLFQAAINRAYNNYDEDSATKRLGAKIGVEHDRVRRLAQFSFPNQTITHRNIGVVAEGFRVFTHLPEYRIESLPAELRNSVLVDNSRLPTSSLRLGKPGENLYKIRRGKPGTELVVLRHFDENITMLVQNEDIAAVPTTHFKPTGQKVVLKNPEGRRLELHAFTQAGEPGEYYSELELGRFQKPFVFALRRI